MYFSVSERRNAKAVDFSRAVKHTSTRKNVVLLLLFLIGVIVFLLAEYLKRFVPNDWGPDEWAARIRDLGFFVAVSISTHVIYLKGIKSEDIKELKDNVSLVIDQDRKMMIHGLTGINQLDHKSLIDSLNKGDILYWHDTYTEELHGCNDTIIRATEKGAKIRFLVIAPFCDNARNRALEVETSDPQMFARSCESFTLLIKKLMDKTDSMRIPDTESNRRSIDLRIYKSHPTMPFYLIEHNGTPVRAYTGFYLCKLSGRMFHLEWGGSANQKLNINDESFSILSELKKFFDARWATGKPYTKTSPWLGKWHYLMIDTKNEDIYNYGTCEITESIEGLSVEGFRLEEIICEGGIPTYIRQCRIYWESDKFFISEKDHDNAADILINCENKEGVVDAPSLLQLKYQIAMHDSNPYEELDGRYNMYGEIQDYEQKSPNINTTSGTIIFRRSKDRLPIPGVSGIPPLPDPLPQREGKTASRLRAA